jgi:hypothetical protein
MWVVAWLDWGGLVGMWLVVWWEWFAFIHLLFIYLF